MSSFSLPVGKDKKVEVEADVKTTAMPIPAYSDIAKAATDLLSKDFYHMNAGKLRRRTHTPFQSLTVTSANLEIKSKAPNGVAYTVKGKSAHNGTPSGSV